MVFLKSVLSRFSHKPTPVVATNMSVDSWCNSLRTQSARFVQRVEMCTALAMGHDIWGTPVGKTHHHTLLQVCLAPSPYGPCVSENTLLIERVLSIGGEYHSAIPIAETFPTGGTLFHPDVHDRICVISDGPSTALAHHLEVERTLSFGDGASQVHLTLAQFAQILDFVSRTTMSICAGGDCKFQTRSFAFTCLAALTPLLPPPTLVRKTSQGMSINGKCGEEEVVDDSVFELGAEVFLGQIPWLVNDPASMQALRLIGVLKDEPRRRVTARLYQ